MSKDFDRWNETKKRLNEDTEPLYFREGEWYIDEGVDEGLESRRCSCSVGSLQWVQCPIFIGY